MWTPYIESTIEYEENGSLTAAVSSFLSVMDGLQVSMKPSGFVYI